MYIFNLMTMILCKKSGNLWKENSQEKTFSNGTKISSVPKEAKKNFSQVRLKKSKDLYLNIHIYIIKKMHENIVDRDCEFQGFACINLATKYHDILYIFLGVVLLSYITNLLLNYCEKKIDKKLLYKEIYQHVLIEFTILGIFSFILMKLIIFMWCN